MSSATAHIGKGDHRLLALALCAFLPLAVLAVLEAARAYGAADEARLRGTVRSVAAAIDSQLAVFVSAAWSMSHAPMLDSGGDLGRFTRNVRPIGEEFGGCFVVIGPGPGHEFQAMTLPDPPRLPARLAEPDLDPGRPLAAVFLRGVAAVSDLFTGPATGRPQIWALAPVQREGQVIRAIAMAFEPSRLHAPLARQDLPPGGFAAIADGGRRILATSAEGDAGMVGRPIPFALVTAEAGRASGVFEGWNLRDEPTTFAFERLQTAPGWTVVVASPRAAQLASARRVIAWTLAGALALLVGLGAVGWAAWRQMTRAARDEAAALRAGRAEIDRLLGTLPAWSSCARSGPIAIPTCSTAAATCRRCSAGRRR